MSYIQYPYGCRDIGDGMGVGRGYEKCVTLEGRACVGDLAIAIGTAVVVTVTVDDILSTYIAPSLVTSVILSVPCLERGGRWGC